MQQKVTLSQRESRVAFALNALNGGMFGLAETLMDTNLILVWFLSHLTTSNFLLGLLGPIGAGGWFLPQLFLSGWIQGRARKIGIYRASTLLRGVTWAGLALTMGLVRDPTLALAFFFPMYIVMRLAAGMSGIPFMEVTVKTIPTQWRGRLFAARLLIGGMLGLVGSRIVRGVLESEIPYPANYAWLAGGALVAAAVGMLSFSLTAEPEGPTRPVTPVLEQVRRGLAALREDADYRHLLLGRALLFWGMAAAPFYTLLAKRVLGAPERAIGDYLLVFTLTRLLVNYPWGWLADTRGLRWVIRGASLGFAVLAALGGLLAGAAHWGWLADVTFPLYWLAYPFFVLGGIFQPAESVAGMNLVMGVAPEDDRALYLGFASTFLGVAVLLGGFSGALVDAFGLTLLFGMSMVASLAAYSFFGRVRRIS